MTDCTRRRLLALGGAITAGAVAGCSGADNAGTAAEGGSAEAGTALETITLENLDDTARTVDVIVQWGDEIEYWETHELGAIDDTGDSSLTLEEGWPSDPGEFQLTVRLSDDDTRAGVSSTALSERDCLDLVVLVSREGELSILTDVSGGECATDTADDGSGS
ncbi:hypothetical protein [Halohasta salina]|uniref:hypothetical protein n=1 Tax=Halohasta salina TaxID=2961621 RepID=UPI0020A2D1D2|nr:hypothetical protein [Halohasta salina]